MFQVSSSANTSSSFFFSMKVYACKQRIHNSKHANIKCAQDELHYRIRFFLKIGKVGADTTVEGKEFQREVV